MAVSADELGEPSGGAGEEVGGFCSAVCAWRDSHFDPVRTRHPVPAEVLNLNKIPPGC